MEELDALRLQATCVHSFKKATVKKESCSQAGIRDCVCRVCGYEKTEEIPKLDHKYKNKVCTVCGQKEPVVKSRIEANTWYTYDNVLYIQNCEVRNAFSISQGRGMMVDYYAVCQSCHVAADSSSSAVPQYGYPIAKTYKCPHCDTWTTVRIELPD